MSSNAPKVLTQLLAARRAEYAEDWSEQEYFEMFSAQQVLRPYRLDNEEKEAGLVGLSENEENQPNASDGGIDGFYVIVNGRLIRNPEEAKDLRELKQNITLDLIIFQATTEGSFQLKRITRLKDTMGEILDFDLEPEEFSEVLNEDLVNGIRTFRTAHKILLKTGFTLNVGYYYISKGDTSVIASLIQNKADTLRAASTNLLPTIKKCTFDFLGADELVALANKPPQLRHSLEVVATMPGKDGGIVALVTLQNYARFITSQDTGNLLDFMFDSNVRAYQGDVDVNLAIRQSLDDPGKEEFWWLNNGITIIASKFEGAHGDLSIDEPQIVNGLQTSQEIYEHFRQHSNDSPSASKKLLVRIVETTDTAVQDRIIRATNSQTNMGLAAMWATDPFQHDIEIYFRDSGLYYDRRKHYWRNKDMPLAKIVGMSELAQAVAAMFLQEPEHARARPARYFRKDGKEYSRVFNKDYGIELYPICAELRKRVAKYLSRQS